MTTSEQTRTDVHIPTPGGETIHAWLYLPARSAPGPAVVMAHGIGGVEAAGLAPFAEHFASEGFAVVAFDYRHWGQSEGSPREMLDIARQRDDYRTVLRWAAAQPAVDPDRIFAWGTSFAGMHIVELAASEQLAGAIAQCPLVDGLAGTTKIPLTRSFRLAALAIADKFGAATGRQPIYVQVSVPAGSFGIIATDDAMGGRHRLEPDDPADWSNRITARSILDITLSRPVRRARQAQCPLLMVVAQDDTMAPTAPAVRVATRAPQGELYRSRGGHYDVYKDGLDHQRVLDTETAFLHKHSSGAERSHVVAPAAHTDSS